MSILRVKESSLHATAAAAASPSGQQQQRPASPAAAAAQAVDEHGVPIKDDRVLQAVEGLAAQVKALQSGRAGSAAGLPEAAPPGGGAGGVGAGVGLVVDGGALALLLQPQHEDAFLGLAKSCDAVICCRVSPMQKAQVSRSLPYFFMWAGRETEIITTLLQQRRSVGVFWPYYLNCKTTESLTL